MGANTYRTDQNGTVRVQADGNYTITTERSTLTPGRAMPSPCHL